MSNTNIDDIKQELLTSQKYEHPFQWDAISSWETSPQLLMEYVDEEFRFAIMDQDLPFVHLMLYIVQSYAYGLLGRFQEGLDSLQVVENKFCDLSNNSASWGQAFMHITTATKAFLRTLLNDLNIANEVISSITKISEMDQENRAALIGLRGVFYGKYSVKGFGKALESFSTAIKIDPNESAWHFLKGKYLSRLRRVERRHDRPGEEEVYHLELSLNKKENGEYLLYVAQMHREKAKQIYRLEKYHKISNNKSADSNVQTEIQQLNEKSSLLYKEALKLKPECSETLLRCAKGFLYLPYPFRDEELAKKLLDKALKLTPNSGYGHHCMAQYYEKVQNLEKAIEHLKVCEELGVFAAIMDLIRLQYQTDKTTNVVQRLLGLLETCTLKAKKCEIFEQLASFHLFVLDDLRKACEYASEIRHLNGNYELLNIHLPICYGFDSRRPIIVNLNEILMDEIKLAILESKLSDEEKTYFDEFLDELISSNGKSESFADDPPQRLKINMITRHRRMGNKLDRGNKTLSAISRDHSLKPSRSALSNCADEQKLSPLSWRRNSRGPKMSLKANECVKGTNSHHEQKRMEEKDGEYSEVDY